MEEGLDGRVKPNQELGWTTTCTETPMHAHIMCFPDSLALQHSFTEGGAVHFAEGFLKILHLMTCPLWYKELRGKAWLTTSTIVPDLFQ